MLKFMLITNQPDLASYAVKAGVGRIFVDLEILGKKERQGGRDTLISRHIPEDVSRVRAAIPGTELLVRINPWHAGSGDEVEDAIARGADLLMLPFFSTVEEIELFVDAVRGRACCIPLVETPAAINILSEVVGVKGVGEIYIGLNDLHLALGMNFMFEPVLNGMIEQAAAVINDVGLPFGFGGVARVGEGLVPGEQVLSEHFRLGSTRVILSRTFHRRASDMTEMMTNMDFAEEIRRLREVEQCLVTRTPEQKATDHAKLLESIRRVLQQIRNRPV